MSTALVQILGAHIVAGRVLAAALTDGQMVETVTGEMLTVNISAATPPVITVTDGNGGVATVVNADVEACNSVVHVVNAVLTPMAVCSLLWFSTTGWTLWQYVVCDPQRAQGCVSAVD
jgi:uncharacterized surface protein with fasciclin (FAS1) repeats